LDLILIEFGKNEKSMFFDAPEPGTYVGSSTGTTMNHTAPRNLRNTWIDVDALDTDLEAAMALSRIEVAEHLEVKEEQPKPLAEFPYHEAFEKFEFDLRSYQEFFRLRSFVMTIDDRENGKHFAEIRKPRNNQIRHSARVLLKRFSETFAAFVNSQDGHDITLIDGKKIPFTKSSDLFDCSKEWGSADVILGNKKLSGVLDGVSVSDGSNVWIEEVDRTIDGLSERQGYRLTVPIGLKWASVESIELEGVPVRIVILAILAGLIEPLSGSMLVRQVKELANRFFYFAEPLN
jgi:hypothetical protein